MSATLIIYPLDDSGQEVAFELDCEDVAIAMTLTVQDITDVTKRRGSFSKTINLNGTDRNNAAFGYAYNIQSFVGGFTPNKRIRAALWDNGIQTFSGSLQLLSIKKTGALVTYEVGIYSEEVAFFRQINETMLAETAGVSGFNHNFSVSGVSGTWSVGSGYVYGFIDGYGYSDAQPNAWNALTNALLVPAVSLTPSFYVKTLIDLIFAQSGYRYQSDFFESPIFGKLVIPYAGGATIQTDLAGQNSYVLTSGTLDLQPIGGNSFAVLPLENVITDTQGYWNASGVFENINFFTSWDANVVFNLTNDDPTNAVIFSFFWFDVANNVVVGNIVNDILLANETKTFETNLELRLNPNQRIEFRILTDQTDEFAGLVLNSGYANMICTENLAALGTVDMRRALPSDITQADLLSDLQKMFNLYFYQAPEDPYLIYIEPFNTFYSSGLVDWTQKSDEQSEMIIQMGDVEARKVLTFKYRDAGDGLSKTYNEVFPQGYGSRVFQTDNYYAKGEQVVETKCATVIPASYNTGLVIGRTFDLNANGLPKERPNGYRIAQYNLIENIQSWALLASFAPTFLIYDDLPFISHIDNPYAPTEDLAFGMPQQIYYKTFASGAITDYTNNNLFNKYWKTYIEETTSKEAMTLELSFMIDSVDIYNLDFRKPIYYGGVLWRLLEVRDYIVGGKNPCRVSLRRILNLAAPSTGAVAINNYYDAFDLVLGENKPQLANPTTL